MTVTCCLVFQSYLLFEDSVFSEGSQPHPHPLQEKLGKIRENNGMGKGKNGEQGHMLVS